MHRTKTFGRRAATTAVSLGIAVLFLTLVLSGLGNAAATHPGTSTASAAALPSAAAPSSSAPSGVRAAPHDFTPPCDYVTATVCVSLMNSAEPNIIPTPPNYDASVTPSPSVSIPLVVKSELPLNNSSAATSGPKAPVALNVTATLWNGDPYYSPYDGTTWHSATNAYFVGPLTPAQTGNNKTYPWWYIVNFSARGPANQAQFLPGMAVTWWIEITTNNSNNFMHNESPHYRFTYGGAWPYSPDPGYPHYAGSAAFGQDVSVAVVPTAPNWNDSLRFTVNTTHADKVVNASISAVDIGLREVTSNGVVVPTPALQFLIPSLATEGVTSVQLTVPASVDLDPNATVTYNVSVADFWGDWISAAPGSYIVGGNGSFASPYFSDELSIVANPDVEQNLSISPPAVIAPGTPVNFTLISRNAPTAINAAEIHYAIELPQIGTIAQGITNFTRHNSTTFYGSLPGFPVGAVVAFAVLAWDFSSNLRVSAPEAYEVQPLGTIFPSIPQNGSFFYVAVYDAGAGSWVNGAAVSIRGQSGFVHSTGNTTDGLAYPHTANSQLEPLIVPAGASYVINVTDPNFRPGDVKTAVTASVTIVADHTFANHLVLYSSKNYSVIENGNLLLFWLNGSLPAVTSTPPVTTALEVGAVAGLVAVSAAVVPLVLWWQTIQRRREAEIKRVTL